MTENNPAHDALEAPPVYFPPASGAYSVAPGLYHFATDFGNGEMDRRLIQLDQNFSAYRTAKLEARAERLGKYYCIERFSVAANRALISLIITHLVKEYPALFRISTGADDELVLDCRLSNELLHFDRNRLLVHVSSSVAPPYASALDALACQIQEDLVLVSRDEQAHWVSAIHLCFPNYWAAENKIGRHFSQAHAPVAGMDTRTYTGDKLVNAMIDRGPYVRFSWGLATDDRLNHHPASPAGIDPQMWYGRSFDPEKPRLAMRIERQCIWGMPTADVALFTLRTTIRDVSEIRQNAVERNALIGAIESMSAEQLQYKGLGDKHEHILSWLRDAG